MRLPQDVMSDSDIAHQRMNGIIPAKKRMQTGFENIAVAIAPRREFSAQHTALLEHGRCAARVGQIFCGREPGWTAADNERLIADIPRTNCFAFGGEVQNY